MTKIVIIEDNETIRAELSVFLNRNGYETEAPERFDDVVSMAVAPATDLVLLDINLPVFDGFYVTREIRKLSQVPIIIVTSRDTEIDELVGMNLGADDFVTKGLVNGAGGSFGTFAVQLAKVLGAHVTMSQRGAAVKCSQCGTENPAGQKFCGECGGQLAEAASEAQPSASSLGAGAATGERRLATDVDLQSVTGGSHVASFILAVDRNGEEAELAVLPQEAAERDLNT